MSTSKCAALLLLVHSVIGALVVALAVVWQASPDLALGLACTLIPVCCWLYAQLWRNG